MAERYGNANHDATHDKKQKMRTSRPKGTQFAAGYVDRAKLRAEAENGAGDGHGDSSEHPKGLDFRLLERAKRGEAASGEGGSEGGSDNEKDGEKEGASLDAVDDEFERIEGSDVKAVERVKTTKKGQYSTAAPPPQAAGQKRSRDQILAELKAAREAAKAAKEAKAAAAAAAEPVLGARFKKIGGAPQQAGSRIEVDSRGREVLILVDEDGHEKRKVRKTSSKTSAPADSEKAAGSSSSSSSKQVLGMEVPEYYRKKLEAEAAAAAAKEVDIFDDVGSDYDPLGGMDSGSSEEDEDEEDKKGGERDAQRRRRSLSASSHSDGEVGEVSDASRSSRGSRGSRGRRRRSPRDDPKETAPPPRKSYFGNSTLLSESTSRGGPSLQDPSVLAALRKAKQMREASEAEAHSQALSAEAAREARLKKLLQSSERDAEDLDMGFGSSRLEDTEDLDDGGGKKVRLSTWKGGAGAGGGGDGGNGADNDDDDDDDGGAGSRGDKTKRKRGGKKRKGDGNNAEDVMRVLERRRGEGK